MLLRATRQRHRRGHRDQAAPGQPRGTGLHRQQRLPERPHQGPALRKRPRPERRHRKRASLMSQEPRTYPPESRREILPAERERRPEQPQRRNTGTSASGTARNSKAVALEVAGGGQPVEEERGRTRQPPAGVGYAPNLHASRPRVALKTTNWEMSTNKARGPRTGPSARTRARLGRFPNPDGKSYPDRC